MIRTVRGGSVPSNEIVDGAVPAARELVGEAGFLRRRNPGFRAVLSPSPVRVSGARLGGKRRRLPFGRLAFRDDVQRHVIEHQTDTGGGGCLHPAGEDERTRRYCTTPFDRFDLTVDPRRRETTGNRQRWSVLFEALKRLPRKGCEKSSRNDSAASETPHRTDRRTQPAETTILTVLTFPTRIRGSARDRGASLLTPPTRTDILVRSRCTARGISPVSSGPGRLPAHTW